MTLRAQSSSLNVAIAASLQKPFEEIAAIFESNYGLKINLISGSSGMLATQIRHNAPFEVFISANEQFIDELRKDNLLITAFPFCKGQLAWWCKYEITPGQIAGAIQDGKIKTIAVANPELAPYGAVAKKWLGEKMESRTARIIFGENIGSVNRYIYSNSVDGAITSLSSMFAEEIANLGFWFPVKTSLDSQLVNVIALIKESSEARKFIDFMKDPKATAILEKYGYLSFE